MQIRKFTAYALLVSAMTCSGAAFANDNRDVVTPQTGGPAVLNDFGHCVRTKWNSGNDECAPAPVAEKHMVRREIAIEARTVYFGFNKATLNETEKQKLDSLANVLKSEASVRSVAIAGYADHIGSETYNDRLSQQRAKTVESYLRERGYLKTTVAKTRWFGKSHPATSCPDTMKRPELIACLQKDRRVEVELDYMPEAAAAPATQMQRK